MFLLQCQLYVYNPMHFDPCQTGTKPQFTPKPIETKQKSNEIKKRWRKKLYRHTFYHNFTSFSPMPLTWDVYHKHTHTHDHHLHTLHTKENKEVTRALARSFYKNAYYVSIDSSKTKLASDDVRNIIHNTTCFHPLFVFLSSFEIDHVSSCLLLDLFI